MVEDSSMPPLSYASARDLDVRRNCISSAPHSFLEDFEFATYPFLGAIGRLRSWFLIAYFFVAYLGVVRRKEWPHFFGFHVVIGMLLEIALQVVGTVSRWMPLAAFWGKVGMHFWTAIAFAYLFTAFESIRCALVGMYADIPFCL